MVLKAHQAKLTENLAGDEEVELSSIVVIIYQSPCVI